ncbi:MAG: hypothetical protein WCQ57_06025 [Verrucomicrobiota bacterium]
MARLGGTGPVARSGRAALPALHEPDQACADGHEGGSGGDDIDEAGGVVERGGLSPSPSTRSSPRSGAKTFPDPNGVRFQQGASPLESDKTARP